MKIKHHLFIAFGIILVALFLTSIVSTTVVPLLGIDKESTTTVWNLMWENLFTSIPTDDVIETLMGLGLPEALSADLENTHETGNSVLSGILGLVPVLALIAGIALVVFKENVQKFLYVSFGLIFASTVTLWFTAPSKLDGVESMYNALNAINPAFPAGMGTMMVDGTEITAGIGFFILLAASLYGIVALVLNKLGKIAE